MGSLTPFALGGSGCLSVFPLRSSGAPLQVMGGDWHEQPRCLKEDLLLVFPLGRERLKSRYVFICLGSYANVTVGQVFSPRWIQNVIYRAVNQSAKHFLLVKCPECSEKVQWLVVVLHDM